MKTIRQRAIQLLTLRLLIMQGGLALICAILFVFWLRVPDANALEVAFSALLGLLILAVVMGGEAAILSRMCSLPTSRNRLLRGAVVLTAAVVLWFAWSALIDQLSLHDVLRAGYLNSRFPHAYRNFFSYQHFLLWFEWFWATLRWLGTGILLALAVAAVQTGKWMKSGVRTCLSASYWATFVAVAILTSFTTNMLLSWTPGHGLHAEMVSLVLRLLAIGAIDLLLGCYLLTTVSVVVSFCAMPGGTPDSSQPRTTENP